MDITFNGLQNPRNIVCWTGFPNILEISEKNSGTYASATITFQGQAAPSVEYDLTVNGYTLLSTNNYNNAKGNRFYAPQGSSTAELVKAAYSLCQALRSVPVIGVNYIVSVNKATNGTMQASVVIRAKEYGGRYNLAVSGRLISSGIARLSNTYSTSTSTLLTGNIENKILVEVYTFSTSLYKPGSGVPAGTFLTALTKEHHGETTYFDLTPLFTSLAEHGDIYGASLYIYSINDGVSTLLTVLNQIYFMTGYSINQQPPFIGEFTNAYLLQNVSRGDKTPYYNNSLLYVYEPSIVLPLLTKNGVNTRNLTITYYNSAMTQIISQTYPIVTSRAITNVTVPLNTTYFEQAFYITIDIPDVGLLKYNVIKPLKATEENQRIFWTNSMGGTSFIDFTGERTEERKTKVDYYQKQHFDFYNKNRRELNKVYDKQVTVTVSLTTHYMEKDGTWPLFDLQNSTNAWTVVNGVEYAVTITDLSVTESNVKGVYTVNIKYEYSLGDTY